MPSSGDQILINRAPVLTLWAAIVAHRLGFDWNECARARWLSDLFWGLVLNASADQISARA